MSNHKLGIILLAAIIASLLAASLLLLRQLSGGGPNAVAVEAANTTLTSSIIGDYSAVVIYFKSRFCPACKLVDPIWAEVSAKYEGKVEAVVVVLNETTMPLFRMYGVRLVPTFIALHNGKPVARITGITGRSALEALFEEALGG